MSKYIQPSINLQSFHCPNCGVFSQHTWSNEIYCIYIQDRADGGRERASYNLNDYATAKCIHCSDISIWKGQIMVYPLTGNIEIANSDLPEDIRVYMTTYNVLKEFREEFLLSDISLSFIEEFDDHMKEVNGNSSGGRNPKHKNMRTVILDMLKHDI